MNTKCPSLRCNAHFGFRPKSLLCSVGAIVMDGATAGPFVHTGPAGGPLWEREHVTRDQSANDKAQSDVMGAKKKKEWQMEGRQGGGAEK